MQEQRHTLPASIACLPGDRLYGRSRPARPSDVKARLFERARIVFQGIAPTMECHLQAVALKRGLEGTAAQVRAGDRVHRVRLLPVEAARVIERMRHADTEAATRGEHAG